MKIHFAILLPGVLISLAACQKQNKASAEITAPPDSVAVSAAASVSAPAPIRAATVPAATSADSMQLLAPFVPVGYRVLFTVAGDLNRDQWPDRVMVLDTAAAVTDSTDYDEREQIQQINRPLLLLLGKPGGRGYTLAARNAHVVQCADCGGACCGDPFHQTRLLLGGALRW